MKLSISILVLTLSILLSFSCSQSVVENSNSSEDVSQQNVIAKDVNVLEFKNLIGDKSILLDVRTPEEYQSGHIEGAININFYDTDFISKVNKLESKENLLIYCASGGRSSKAMSNLKGKEFNKIYNLKGGFSTWKKNENSL